MGLKTFIGDVKFQMAQMLVKNNQSFFNTLFMAGEGKFGKMQPSDFARQVESNESWVYACVMAIAESVAMTKLHLYYASGNKVKEVEEHIFLNTWQNVNPFMNNFELRELTEAYQLLCGNAYWYIVRGALGVPAEIWPVPAQYVKIIPSKKDFIGGYLYQAPGEEKLAFSTDEIIHFKYSNPNNMYYGRSPLLAAAYEVDVNEYMNQYQVNMFKNSGVPEAILTTEQTVQDAQQKRIREQWKQLYVGPKNAGKVAILQKGVKYQAIQLSARELAYIQSKGVNRDTILGIFRVPKSILGLTEDVNRANAEAADYTFGSRNILPKLLRSQEKLNEKLLPMYPQSGNSYLYVEYENPVPKDKEQIIKDRESRLSTYYSSINEEREKNGDKPVPWGDVPLAPLNIYPLGAAPVPADNSGDGDKPKLIEVPKKEIITIEPKAIFSRDRAKILYKQRFDSETYQFRKEIVKLFDNQRMEVLDNLKRYFRDKKGIVKDSTDAFIFIRSEAEKEFSKKMKGNFEQMYMEGVKSGKRLADIDINFNLDNPVVERFLKEKIFQFSFEVNDTTIEQLRGELSEGLKNGETGKDLGERVNKIFDFAESYRGMRIARTETSEVENRALKDVWDKSGVVEEKEWLHGGGGENPRPEHQAMDGQKRGMGERFSNGLMYPGDSSVNDPGQICNCTCSMLPVVKK